MSLVTAQTPPLTAPPQILGKKRHQPLLCQIRMVQAAHCPLVCVRNAKNAGNIHPGSRPFARLLLIGRDLLARPMRLEQSEGECGTAGQTFLALRSTPARWRPSNNMAVCRELCESVVFCFD